jgi:hypothetical protein
MDAATRVVLFALHLQLFFTSSTTNEEISACNPNLPTPRA